MSLSPVHNLRIPDVFSELETSPVGLASEAVLARLSLFGPNALAKLPEAPTWRKLSQHIVHPMALLLWIAGILELLSGSAALAVVIWLVIVLNAAFSYWQEHRTEQALAALERLLPAQAQVIRAGQEVVIPAHEIVPGDMLVLAQGDSIPADARVVEQSGLRINQATLTGESMAAPKTAEASLHPDLTDLEQPNLVFAGSSVVSGTGRAVVYATGSTTQFGRIARLTQAVLEEPSPLQRRMGHLTRILSAAALGIGLTVFIVGILDVGIPQLEAFALGIGIVVAMLPEGLRPAVTLSLAIAVERLARRGVLVKKLASMETLGKISVICTDKSGTLTYNQMVVRDVWVAGQGFDVTGRGYQPEGSISPAPSGLPVESDFNMLLTAAMLCNNARLLPPTPDRSRWTALGDPTEAALRALALKGGIDEETVMRAYPRIYEIPFDAARKRMSTVNRDAQGTEMAFVKGAPREVLQCSTHILMRGEVRPLDEIARTAVLAANDDYARNARRVLALAFRTMPRLRNRHEPEEVERDLTFLGLAAMMDPPRSEVVEAIQVCREAGIRMVMITGDYGLTAESLAHRVGMLTSSPSRIITGSEVEAMSDADLQQALGEEAIFARMAPEHKLRVVAAFQARDDVVAFSGDGVNDAPALRKADISFAMGTSGTDVAREAADIILTNDNFAAIVDAIAEGRAIYDNIHKSITYMLASNVPEIMPFVLTALLRIPLALSVAQVLAIDLGTDLVPALALGTEPPEPELMRSAPRHRDRALLNSRIAYRAFWLGGVETLLCYAGFLGVYYLSGNLPLLGVTLPAGLPLAASLVISPENVYPMAKTVFFAGVVTAQVGNAIACRTQHVGVRRLGPFRNRFLWSGLAVQMLLGLALIYVQPVAGLLGHVALPPVYWVALLSFAPLLYGLDRIREVLLRRSK